MPVPDDENQLEGMEKGPAFLLHKEGFSIDDYTLIERIGEGTFGEVWRAERAGFPVALKILKTTVNSEETQRELESLEKLKRLHHKYLLHTQNFWSDGDRLFIEMELADGGSLKERLRSYRDIGKNVIPEDELLKYFTEVGKALDYLHGHRPVFLHRDIKPANILLVQGSAKLADFGLLRQVSGDNSSTKTQGGTFPYMAPESIKDDRFSVQTDLFAFAVTYAELRQGSLPFPGNNQFQICQKILDDPPKLSEAFDPEERKVLLRALAKDPAERFSSCGEFVFELNRVVPWLPATTIYVFPAPPPKAEQAAPPSSKGTTAKQPRVDDHGTSRKNSPTTMDAIDLQSDEATPGASTVSKKAGTVVNSSRPRGAKAASTKVKPAPTPTTSPQTPTARPKSIPPVAPTPATAKPASSKKSAKTLAAAALLALIVSGIAGIWFVTTRGGNDEVRKLIDEKKYAEAARKLENTAMDHDSRERYRKEVETKWWNEIPRPGAKDELTLAKQKKEVQEFLTYFKSHAEARSLRDEIEARLADAVPPPDGFHEHLTQAREKLAAKQFAECLSDLSAAKKMATTEKNRKLVNEKLDDLMDRLLKEYAAERPTKPNAKAVLAAHKQLESFLRNKNLPWADDIQDKLDADVSLALAYVGRTDASFQLYADLLRRGKNALVRDQTALFIGLIPSDQAFTSLAAKNGTVNVPPKELYLLNQLAAAYGPNADNRADAVAALISLMPEMPAEVTKAMWPALADLEKLIRFKDLLALDKSLAAAPVDDTTRDAISKIIGSVLTRKVEADNFLWQAKAEERGACLAWIQRVQKPADSLLALKAECLAESGGSVKELGEMSFPLQADWYGSYVHALALEKTGKLPDAADVIASKLTGKQAALKPAARSARSLHILRGAVRSLQNKDTKQFAGESEAKRAITWLNAVSEFAESAKDEKAVDDAIALAFAAVKAADAKSLDVAGAKINKTGSAAGYYWLAKAFEAEGQSPAKVLSNFDKMLEAKTAAPDTLQKAAAADGGRLALQLAKENALPANRKWDEADAHAKLAEKFALRLRKWEMPTAAKLFGDAAVVEAIAAGKKAPAGMEVDASYQIFEKAVKKALDEREEGFQAPVVIAKLEFISDLGPGRLSKERLVAAEQAGVAALRWAKKVGDVQLECKGIVKLADVRMCMLVFLNQTDRKKYAKDFRAKFEEIRTGLELARKMDKYTEKYDGELAFKIGNMLYQACDLPDNSKEDMRREAAQAKRELEMSRKHLKESKMTAAERRASGAEEALNAVEQMLKDEGFLALLQ